MLIGREKEISILSDALSDNTSHFVAIYGRRRIGKTYLVKECFKDRFTFYHAGLSEGNLSDQLTAFAGALKDAGHEFDGKISGWLSAFEQLKDVIRSSKEKKKIIFIDELSWMDTPKSGLITALEHFWNGWASARDDIILIVCASATSWMLSKIIHNKGGLYNRITEKIHLKQFSLYECEQYVKSRQLVFNRMQILQCYMIFGGVPFYWSLLKKGLSAEQNIDEIFFAEDAPLKTEFKYLFASIFKNPEAYIKIVETLGKKKVGMSRDEIIEASKLSNSGELTVKLEELEACGFIRKYAAFGMKKKGAIYQLTDYFSLFYYQFLEKEPTDNHFWINQINMPKINTWSGLAFERVCLDHVECIKHKLGISGIYTDVNSWQIKADVDNGIFGSQIDLLIVRKDKVINLCEMKYSNTHYAISKSFAESLNRKISDFVAITNTRYAIHSVLVTTVGVLDNMYSGIVQNVIDLDDLFCNH